MGILPYGALFRRPLGYPQTQRNVGIWILENLDLPQMVSRFVRVTQCLEEGSMGGWRVRFPVSDTAETVIPLAAGAHSRIPRLGAFAALFLVVAVPIDEPPVAANSTLKCYDSFGNFEPCVTQASTFLARFNGGPIGTHQPTSWTATAPYHPASWTATALYQQPSWAMTAVGQPANWTTGAPAAQPGSTPLKRPASASCRRGLLPCLFSSLRRGLTHAVAVVGQARPAAPREHL